MTSHPHPVFGLDRRTFLLGAAAAGVATACGGGSDDEVSYSVVQRYPADVFVPGEIRLPFSLANAAEFVTDGPDELGAQIVDLDGEPIGDRIVAVRRDITPAPYYAFRTTIDTPGVYGDQNRWRPRRRRELPGDGTRAGDDPASRRRSERIRHADGR